MLEIRGLTKSFGKLQVLRGVTETIKDGEVVTLIGPSGSGKSTFLRCLNLLEMPDGGEILYNGENILAPGVDIPAHRKRMGMVFQHFNVFPNMSVAENITMAPIMVKKMPKDQAREMAENLLRRIGLYDKRDERPTKLSGGQKQRLAIVRALAMEPEVMVLDEATAMLDPQGRQEVLEIVSRINKERGMTVVMITQYMEEAVMADRVAVMKGGELIMTGTPKEVFSRGAELRAHGLDLPAIARLRDELIAGGMDIPKDAITAQELADAICR